MSKRHRRQNRFSIFVESPLRKCQENNLSWACACCQSPASSGGGIILLSEMPSCKRRTSIRIKRMKAFRETHGDGADYMSMWPSTQITGAFCQGGDSARLRRSVSWNNVINMNWFALCLLRVFGGLREIAFECPAWGSGVRCSLKTVRALRNAKKNSQFIGGIFPVRMEIQFIG